MKHQTFPTLPDTLNNVSKYFDEREAALHSIIDKNRRGKLSDETMFNCFRSISRACHCYTLALIEGCPYSAAIILANRRSEAISRYIHKHII